jgi:site-specific recombinase XerD
MASIEKKITPHKLRHTFATHYYDKTKDLRRLQEILGHSSSKTTDIYAHILDNKVEKAIDSLYEEN